MVLYSNMMNLSYKFDISIKILYIKPKYMVQNYLNKSIILI